MRSPGSAVTSLAPSVADRGFHCELVPDATTRLAFVSCKPHIKTGRITFSHHPLCLRSVPSSHRIYRSESGPPPGDESPPSKHQRSESPSKNGEEIDLDDSDDDYGPSAPAAPKSAVGPSLPRGNQDEIDLDDDSDSDSGPAPPPRNIGPAPPPANISTRPTEDADSSSDSEDDYGPALPGSSNVNRPVLGPQLPEAEPQPQRDSWMLAPPTSGSYTERDPTRIRTRKFNSKPSASAGSAGISSIWTETPEEKLKRLQDSVLGREDKSKESATAGPVRSKEEEERQRKIAASIEAQRGKSLFEEHQNRREQSGKKVEEDDPSKRAFDKEKDMSLGGQINNAKRRELMNNAANFGGRFQKGSFL